MEWNTVQRAGRKDRNRHKHRMNRGGQTRLVYVKDINRNIPITWRWARGDGWIPHALSIAIANSERHTSSQITAKIVIPCHACHCQHFRSFGMSAKTSAERGIRCNLTGFLRCMCTKCSVSYTRPRGLTFTWWGCWSLCFWHKPTELAHILFILFVCLFLSLWLVLFHSINSPDNSPLSHSVLPVLYLPYWSFQLYISLRDFFSPDIILCGWLGLKHQLY